MIKRKKKRKNPKLKYSIEEVLANFYPDLDNIDAEYINKGWYAHVYKIKLKSKKLYNNTVLYPNTYVIKILLEKDNYDDHDSWKPLTVENIKKLEILSKYGLIPKIYYIDKYVIIMKFIEGSTLKQLLKNRELSKRKFDILMDKIYDLKINWEKLGFQHGDLHEDNILITNSNKIYFIDPRLTKIREDRDDNDELNDLERVYFKY